MKLLSKALPILLSLSLLLGACSPPTPAASEASPTVTLEPSSTPEPAQTSEPTDTEAPTETPGPTDQVWQRVKTNNKLVVGISLNSPPFSSLSPLFKMEGLDVALADELGNRLNIPVEIQIFSPQGLTSALLINQIDIALAGIPNSAAAGGQLSFSSPYLVDDTVVLARKVTPIPTITDFTKLSIYRIGVERGSVSEKMAQTYLVDAGLMAKAKLLHYDFADQAIQDMSANRLDVVLLGRAAGDYYTLVNQDLHGVGTGFAEQDLSVAMRANLPGLKAQIDRALGSMQTDGTLDALTRKYVRGSYFSDLPVAQPVGQIVVTPAPAATSDPSACLDGLKFLLDETNGAIDMTNPPKVKTEKIFTQTWKVQNTGTCAWTPQYHLAFSYGNVAGADMKGVPGRIASNVNPGDTTDLTVELVAPISNGFYQGFWQLQNERGQLFGQALWIGAKAIKGKNQAANTAPSIPTLKTCKTVNTGPAKDPRVRDNFDVTWEVTNTSGYTWKADAVTYVYVSGDKFQKLDTYSIPEDQLTATTNTFTVDMTAPVAPGQYNTVWNVIWGKTILCTMAATINVVPR